MNRPELERLLEDIKNGIIDVIVAIKVDRLTRDGYDGQWLLKECNKYNVTLDLLYEPYDINTVNGEMMYGMNLLFAQRERKEIGSRTKRGLEEAVRQGKYPNKSPLGYIRNEEGFLEIDPVSSIVVKDIFKLYASGMSMNAIAKKFEEEKRYNKINTRWREDKILKIISNPIYKGELHWRRTISKGKDEIIIPNHSPKIVSEELFDKCQVQINKNKHGGYGNHIHIFSGLIKCPYCHKIMSNYFTVKQRASGPKEFYYVTCKRPTCEGKGKIYNTEKIENELIKLLNEIATDYKNDKYTLVLAHKEKSEELDTINKALSKLKKEEEKLMELYLQSSINIDIINKKNETIQSEISKLEIKKSNLEDNNIVSNKISVKESLENKSQNKLLGTENIWHMLDRKDKKKILNMYIKSLDISLGSNYSIIINDIVFQNEFIKYGINNLVEIALECIKESNKKLTINKPVLETKVNDYSLSLKEELENNRNDFKKFWDNLISENSILYPIYDLSNVIKDIKVKVIKAN